MLPQMPHQLLLVQGLLLDLYFLIAKLYHFLSLRLCSYVAPHLISVATCIDPVLIYAATSILTVSPPALEALLGISLRTLNSFVGKHIYLSTMEHKLIGR